MAGRAGAEVTKKTPRKPKSENDKDARLKAALKANLARRKAQAKARSQAAQTKGQDDG